MGWFAADRGRGVVVALIAGLLTLSAGARPVASAAPDRGMAILSASVASDGTLQFGSGATDAALLSVPGSQTVSYLIDFDRDVTQCVYAVTTRSNSYLFNWAAPARKIDNTKTSNEVLVRLSADGTTNAQAPFSLLVYCAR